MAKKKAAARRNTPKRAATKGKAAKTPNARAGKTKGPRALALPGMEQTRNVRLDRFCESIGEGRDAMNKLRGEEKADLQGALREMHDRRVDVYRHAGVELVKVAGEEKLRVRTSKEIASDITPDDDEGGESDSGGDQGDASEAAGE